MAADGANSAAASQPTRSAALDVHLLGLVDFEAALLLQNRLAYELSGRDDRKGFLLICEHPPVITIGREGSVSDIRATAAELENCRVPVKHTARGGGSYVHGPGQLSIYPVVPLDRLCIGVEDYRRGIESAVIRTARELKIAARIADSPGVRGRVGQFAFYGVGIRNWITQHGMYVNVNPAAGLLELVNGSPQVRTSTLAAERMRPVAMGTVRASLITGISDALGYTTHHVFTGHPWLRRSRQQVYAFT